MSICIISATSLELQNFQPNGTDILITGLGATATTYHLTHYLRHKKPSLIIQAGIGGSFNQDLHQGSAVIISADRFADLGVQENNQWKDIFDLQLADPRASPFSDGWLLNPHQDLLNSLSMQQVNAITINEITTLPVRIQQLKEKYNPSVESMEGAAFHYVCLQEQIPFLQLRTISNYIGERNKEKWALKQAIQNLVEHLQIIIRQVK
ncbi:MAG: futalosine hydrolase [Chitinophagaceae bacterium]